MSVVINQQSPSRRTIVRKHKNELSLSSSQRSQVKELVTKLMRDYKSVSQKRGSRNFSLDRWIQKNIK